MILIIDPTVSKAYRFFLLNKECRRIAFKELQSNRILEELDRFLKDNHKKPEQIKILGIFEGAGSFTSLRNTAAIANVWQNIYNLKVIGIDTKKTQKLPIEKVAKKLQKQSSKSKVFIPKYSALPNITISKSKN